MYYYVVVVNDVIGLNNSVFTQKQLDQLLATFSFLFEVDGRISCSFCSRPFYPGFRHGFRPSISRRCKRICMPNKVTIGKQECIYRFSLYLSNIRLMSRKNYIDYRIALLSKTLILVVIIFF